MAKQVYLGIDLGTSGLKALLVDRAGTILGSGYEAYGVSTPHRGYAEQQPERWLDALKTAFSDALRSSGLSPSCIAGIGLSGQMHGTVLLGRDDRPLCPAVLWCDQRSAPQAARLKETLGTRGLGDEVQNPISAGFQAATLRWFYENDPALFERIRCILLPKDYLRFRLTGQIGTEPTDACATLLFNCKNQRWSERMIQWTGIRPEWLPDAAHTPCSVSGYVTGAAAKEYGLPEGIPVVYGGGDQPMQALGNGILQPGEASITLGTGGQILVPVDRPVYDPALRTHLFCHALPDTWYVMGAVLNCCLAQNWFARSILRDPDLPSLHTGAAAVPAGSGGLFFLPYLAGERTPHMDPEARGLFFGLTLSHTRDELTRAVLEGISYSLLDALTCIQAPVSRFVLSGGGARSPLWRQILADMLDRPVCVSGMKEQAGIGAAICAMEGTGAYASLREACAAIVRSDPRPLEADPENAAFYRDHFPVFREIYRRNADLLRACSL